MKAISEQQFIDIVFDYAANGDKIECYKDMSAAQREAVACAWRDARMAEYKHGTDGADDYCAEAYDAARAYYSDFIKEEKGAMKTKKAILSALKAVYKAQDRAALFDLYHRLTGLHGKQNDWNEDMRKYFLPFCTSRKMCRIVGALCETKWLKEKRNYGYEREYLVFIGERPRHTKEEICRRQRETALKMLRRLYKETISNYTKVPMFGHTHLYFCHPSYAHSDYNKVCCCEIAGNESFCKKVVELGERILKAKEA